MSKLDTIHRDADAAGQLADLRDLIAKRRRRDRLQPEQPRRAQPRPRRGQAAGIKTVSVDAYVTDADTYNLYNNQIDYAYLGAKWLFEQLGGKGNVWYTRGIAGHPADSDRDTGFKKALAEYPDIKVLPNADGVVHRLGPGHGHQLANEFISSGEYDDVDGIWTSGMDSQVVDAIKAAGKDSSRSSAPTSAPSSTSCSTDATTRASRAQP